MRQLMTGMILGGIGGYLAFTEKGQKISKDLCMLAIESSGIGDEKVVKALKKAVIEDDAPAIEEHPREHAHAPAHNPGNHEIHTVDMHAATPPHETIEKETHHAIPRTETQMP